jgi:hypothetical protein
MTAIDAHTSIRVPDHVAHRPLGEESVLLNLRTGHYHGLNPIATAMFGMLLEHGRPGPAAEAVADEFGAPPDEVLGDIIELCAGLLERGLIETVEQPA